MFVSTVSHSLCRSISLCFSPVFLRIASTAVSSKHARFFGLCPEMSATYMYHVLLLSRAIVGRVWHSCVPHLSRVFLAQIGGVGKVQEKCLREALGVVTAGDLFRERAACLHVMTPHTGRWLIKVAHVICLLVEVGVVAVAVFGVSLSLRSRLLP